MAYFADAEQIIETENMIAQILNATDAWGGTISDPRRAAEVITKSRVYGTIEVIKAIAGNLQHGYWGVLSALVAVAHDAFLPFHLGQHGLPLILAADPERVIASVTKAGDTLTGGEGYITALDIGREFVVYDGPDPESGDVIVAARIADLPTANTFTAEAYTVGDTSTDIIADQTDNAAVVIMDTYQAGLEADPDEIDAYRADRTGLYGSTRHDLLDENGLPSELSRFWSIVNSQLKFTGYGCKVPLIQFEELDCDARTPVDFLSTIVKLAPIWNLKEGDNILPIADRLVTAGRDDLKQIASGVMTVTPVSDIMPVQAEL